MTWINPLAVAVAASPSAQRALSTDKAKQVRRAQALSKDISAEDDRLEHQVESSDAISAVHPDDEESFRQSREELEQQQRREDELPHIDIRA